MENEGTEHSPATPVLAVNVTAVVQIFDWTGMVGLMILHAFTPSSVITVDFGRKILFVLLTSRVK